MSDSYPVRTIVEIARIPEEAFDRFLAEFPLMVATARAQITLIEAICDEPDDAAILAMMEGAKWIDDDKGDVSISVDVETCDGERVNLVDVKGNHKRREFNVKFGEQVK